MWSGMSPGSPLDFRVRRKLLLDISELSQPMETGQGRDSGFFSAQFSVLVTPSNPGKGHCPSKRQPDLMPIAVQVRFFFFKAS